MEIKRINFEDTLKVTDKIYIDARSPSEYEVDHIIDAINAPILSDEERAIIGKIYKTEGSFIARKKGVEIVAPKLQTLIDFLLKSTENFTNIIFYCSRGGLRSHSLATFFSLVSDKNIFVINKGYKAYRQFIISYFKNYNKKFLVIDGFTGSGKTKILKILKNENLPVIDLENLAKHRGSVFGSVGIDEKISQKKFESLLYKECERVKNHDIVIVEGESRFIGKCMLPSGFYQCMNESPHIWIETTDELRIEIIKEDYIETFKNIDELILPLNGIKDFLGNKKVELLKKEIKNKNFDFVIHFLLKNITTCYIKRGDFRRKNFIKSYFSEI